MNHDLIDRLIATLETANGESRALDQALIDAAFLLERSRGLHHAAWPDHVRSAAVTTDGAESLKRAVAAYVHRTARGSWALGKSADPAQRETLVAALRRNLAPGGCPFELYQALIALEDCGAADVFAGATSRSAIHVQANRQYAQRFLDRHANLGGTGKLSGLPVVPPARTASQNSPTSAGNSTVRAALMSF